jgi:hypothetical protein
VAQLIPANSSDPTALSLAALQGSTLVQINSSAAVLALAKSAGFDSVYAFMPGLQMFWEDVSASTTDPLLCKRDQASSAPFGNLSAPATISATTSVHAVEQPGLPLEDLSADAPRAAKLQCALKGGRTLQGIPQNPTPTCYGSFLNAAATGID